MTSSSMTSKPTLAQAKAKRRPATPRSDDRDDADLRTSVLGRLAHLFPFKRLHHALVAWIGRLDMLRDSLALLIGQ